jgi:hypothetical protein
MSASHHNDGPHPLPTCSKQNLGSGGRKGCKRARIAISRDSAMVLESPRRLQPFGTGTIPMPIRGIRRHLVGLASSARHCSRFQPNCRFHWNDCEGLFIQGRIRLVPWCWLRYRPFHPRGPAVGLLPSRILRCSALRGAIPLQRHASALTLTLPLHFGIPKE